MALPAVADLVYEETTVAGVGPATLTPVPGFFTFAESVGVGVQCYYVIRHPETGAREVGEGHLSDATTLARDRPIRTSNGDALVAFAAGTKQVYVTDTAERINRRWRRETPAGVVNGVNTTFTLAAVPAEGLTVWVNGLAQRAGAGNDFTLSGATLTFLAGAIPQTGDALDAEYSA